MVQNNGYSLLGNILQSFLEGEDGNKKHQIARNSGKELESMPMKSVNAHKSMELAGEMYIGEASMGNSSAASLALTSLDIPPVHAAVGEWEPLE